MGGIVLRHRRSHQLASLRHRLRGSLQPQRVLMYHLQRGSAGLPQLLDATAVRADQIWHARASHRHHRVLRLAARTQLSRPRLRLTESVRADVESFVVVTQQHGVILRVARQLLLLRLQTQRRRLSQRHHCEVIRNSGRQRLPDPSQRQRHALLRTHHRQRALRLLRHDATARLQRQSLDLQRALMQRSSQFLRSEREGLSHQSLQCFAHQRHRTGHLSLVASHRHRRGAQRRQLAGNTHLGARELLDAIRQRVTILAQIRKLCYRTRHRLRHLQPLLQIRLDLRHRRRQRGLGTPHDRRVLVGVDDHAQRLLQAPDVLAALPHQRAHRLLRHRQRHLLILRVLGTQRFQISHRLAQMLARVHGNHAAPLHHRRLRAQRLHLLAQRSATQLRRATQLRCREGHRRVLSLIGLQEVL